MIKIIFLTFILYIYDQGLFRIIEKNYCKKNKGICKNCNCWSCEKSNQDYKRKKKECDKDGQKRYY